MEGCFTFQLGGACFSDEGASFLSEGEPHGWASVLKGRRFRKKLYCRIGEAPSFPPPLLWETLSGVLG